MILIIHYGMPQNTRIEIFHEKPFQKNKWDLGTQWT